MSGNRLSRPLTFGVEFEFSLATIEDRFETNLPPDESRTLRFTPSQSDINLNNDCFMVTDRTIQDHISETLTDAGYPCVPGYQGKNHNYLSWEIKRDGSIRMPYDYEYKWFQMELTSPAFFYCGESIQEIMKICSLITSKYRVDVNESTGLHVHVGNGHDNGGKFSFRTLRALASFFWTFEPQLNTLHPPYRQDDHFFRSMRAMTHWEGKHPHVPEPLDGLATFMGAKTPQKLADLTNAQYGRNAYNFFHSLEGCEGIFSSGKKTIEFRQHESTFDQDRVKHWIKVVVGIVEFCRDAEFYPNDFTQLLLKIESEDIRAPKEKPQLCEKGFTVIDLLIALKLYPSAEFYMNRGVYGPYRPDYYWPEDRVKGLAEQLWEKHMARQEVGDVSEVEETQGMPKEKRLLDKIYDRCMAFQYPGEASKEELREPQEPQEQPEQPEDMSTIFSEPPRLLDIPEEPEIPWESSEGETPEPESKSVFPYSSYPSF
jgi:hypothetical protein